MNKNNKRHLRNTFLLSNYPGKNYVCSQILCGISEAAFVQILRIDCNLNVGFNLSTISVCQVGNIDYFEKT